MKLIGRAILVFVLLLVSFFCPACSTSFGDWSSGPPQPVPILDVARPDAASSDAMVSLDTGKGDAPLTDAETDASDSSLDADF